jgi:hypothetical protein
MPSPTRADSATLFGDLRGGFGRVGWWMGPIVREAPNR